MIRNPMAQRLDVDAVGVMNRAVAFDHVGDNAAVFFRQELRGVVADVTKALHDHALAVERAAQARLRNVFGMAEEFLQRILHTAPRRLDPALNAASVDRLARHAGARVDIGGVHPRILVSHDRHLALAGAHVGGGDVLRRINQVAFDKLIGKATGDLLDLIGIIFTRVNT